MGATHTPGQSALMCCLRCWFGRHDCPKKKCVALVNIPHTPLGWQGESEGFVFCGDERNHLQNLILGFMLLSCSQHINRNSQRNPTRARSRAFCFVQALVQKTGAFCFSVCGSKDDRLAWDQDHAGSSPARLTNLGGKSSGDDAGHGTGEAVKLRTPEQICPAGGTGRRGRLRPGSRKGWEFESLAGHQISRGGATVAQALCTV